MSEQRQARRGKFQASPPVKGATLLMEGIVKGILYKPTPPVKAATKGITQIITAIAISIHAAREGGDKSKRHRRPVRSVFRATQPVKEGTIKDGGTSVAVPVRATPPGKAATPLCIRRSCGLTISIHAAREGGDCYSRYCDRRKRISIHAAGDGGDAIQRPYSPTAHYFNPRRP